MIDPNEEKICGKCNSNNVFLIKIKSTEKKNFFQIVSSLEIANVP
jgi:hypothetical protein